MYHALLTNRYLTSRVIPLIAVAAVALCVALVIVVVSVMTGFLDMVKNSGRKLMGDVVVSYPVSGIPHYERLIKRIELLPEAFAATPVVDAFGLLKMPYPDKPQKQTEEVQFWGIEPISFAKVTGYEKTLYWGNPDEKPNVTKNHWDWLFNDLMKKRWKDVLASMTPDQRAALMQSAMSLGVNSLRTVPSLQQIREHIADTPEEEWQQLFRVARNEPKILQDALTMEQWQSLLENDPRLLQSGETLTEGLTLTHGKSKDNRTIVLGMHVSEGNERQHDGSYEPMSEGYWWMPRYQVTLTTLPIAEGLSGKDSAESRILQVVNEFVSGVFLIDNKRVMIPIDIAQGMLHLDETPRVDDDDPTKVIGVDPARATMVLVRAKEGVTPERLRDAVEIAYGQFTEELRRDDTAVIKPPLAGMGGVSVKTWLQQQAEFIGPVEKEREMMRTLFSLVYVVCAGLVLAIFWAIVYEKTRDIGILRSVGASRIGISWIFLRYGLVVGALGAIAGFGLGYLIVNKINVIHEALSKPPVGLPIAVLALALVSLAITIIKSFSRNLLPVVLGGMITATLLIVGLLALWLYLIGGFLMWDPRVYYFARIPNEVDLQSAIITMIGAVVFSVVGAFVPAAKAADTDPVRALRYEQNNSGNGEIHAMTTASQPKVKVRPPTTPTQLSAANLRKTYRMGKVDVPVLKGVNLNVSPGEWVAVLGASGCGKSTLLHLLGDLDRPDVESGSVVFEGKSLEQMSLHDRNVYRNQTVGFVFQFYHLLPELNVLENTMLHALVKPSLRGARFWVMVSLIGAAIGAAMALGAARGFDLVQLDAWWKWLAAGTAGALMGALIALPVVTELLSLHMNFSAERKQIAERAAELLQSFGLSHRLKHRPRELSGGERQRVAIARALMNGPQILLADEPTGNLDEKTGGEILDLIAAQHRQGLTIIMVTHDESIARRADRVVRLHDGRVVEN